MIRAQQQPFEPVLVHQGQQQQWCSNWPKLRKRPSTTIHQRWPKWKKALSKKAVSKEVELNWVELSYFQPKAPILIPVVPSAFIPFPLFFHFWSLIMNVHQRKKKKNAAGWLARSTCMSHPCLTFPFLFCKNNKEDGDLQQRRPLNWQRVEFLAEKKWVKNNLDRQKTSMIK